MNADSFVSLTPGAPVSALVVDPDAHDLVLLTAVLEGEGFTVTTTAQFRQARLALVESPPALLVTAIRLGAYNGLQLVLRARTAHRHMPILVTSLTPDVVLHREAEQLEATIVPKPLTAQEVLTALRRTALRPRNADGTVDPIRPPFERRVAERRGVPILGVLPERRITDRRQNVPLRSRVIALE